jgi:hypothetical protein
MKNRAHAVQGDPNPGALPLADLCRCFLLSPVIVSQLSIKGSAAALNLLANLNALREFLSADCCGI